MGGACVAAVTVMRVQKASSILEGGELASRDQVRPRQIAAYSRLCCLWYMMLE